MTDATDETPYLYYRCFEARTSGSLVCQRGINCAVTATHPGYRTFNEAETEKKKCLKLQCLDYFIAPWLRKSRNSSQSTWSSTSYYEVFENFERMKMILDYRIGSIDDSVETIDSFSESESLTSEFSDENEDYESEDDETEDDETEDDETEDDGTEDDETEDDEDEDDESEDDEDEDYEYEGERADAEPG